MNPTHPAAPNRRRRTRNLLWLVGIVPSLLLLLFAGKVTLMLSAQASGDTSYSSEDFGAAADSFGGNRTLNWFEGWVAPFNEGTARHRLEDYDRAIDRFEEALPQAPDEEECTVRINLALSHEARGDLAAENDDAEAAVEDWTTGREVLTEGECPTDAPGGEEQTEDAATVDERLRQKLETSEEPEQEKEKKEQGEKSEEKKEQQKQKQEELEKRNRQGVERHKDSREVEEFRYRDYDEGSHW